MTITPLNFICHLVLFVLFEKGLNFFLQAMIIFEKLSIKANNHAWSVAHISTPIEKENKIA